MDPKQEKFLTDLQAHLQKGTVTTQEMAQVVRSILQLVGDLQKRLQGTIEANKGEGMRGTAQLKQDISALEGRVEQLGIVLSNTENKLSGDSQQKVVQVFGEIRRLESLIPSVPSFEPLLQRISDVESKIPTLPDEQTAEDVRDKLESLEDDDRLDAKAIKNLPKSVNQIISGGIGGSSGIKGVTAGTNIAVDGNPYTPMVTLNIPVSVAPPSNPVLNALWISI